MPAPTIAQLDSLARSAVQDAGLVGEHAPLLAQAMADMFAKMLGAFLTQAQVAPGIPAAVDPLSGSGVTVGPGRLLPPPAGGPSAAKLEPLAATALQSAGLVGSDIQPLTQILAQAGELALTQLCTQAMVAPGIAIAGFVTVAPGRLA